jgi:hypothetical protein
VHPRSISAIFRTSPAARKSDVGTIQVPVTGGPGQMVQILVSTDLKSWSLYTMITLSAYGAGQFSDLSVTS